MNVQSMSYRAGNAELSTFLPVMHPLWGKDYSALGNATNISFRVQRQAKSNAEGMGGLGPQRAGNSQASEGAVSDWPGRTHGIREPELFETPLSWEEVRIAMKVAA